MHDPIPWHIIHDADSLERSLTNHRPPPHVVHNMKVLRGHGYRLGAGILQLVPDSRYKSLAITALEESIMWAMKAMALDPKTAGEPDPLFDEGVSTNG